MARISFLILLGQKYVFENRNLVQLTILLLSGKMGSASAEDQEEQHSVSV